MAGDQQNSRERAEARFERLQRQKREGEAAMMDYEAQAKAVDDKTARLKAARMAKEAAEREAAANAPPKPTKTRKRASTAG